MQFLNKVYFYLNLSAAAGIGNIKEEKMDVSISNSKTKKNIVYTYILFCLTTLLFIYFSFFGTNYEKNATNINKEIIISIIIFLITIVYCLVKIKTIHKIKESKPQNINIYNRELPSNLTPAHARLLIEDGAIDEKTLASTILDLIDRGYLKLETGNREDIFSKELYISITDKNQDDLFAYEKYMIKWFFNQNRISSKELHKKLSSKDTSQMQCEYFYIFQGLVLLSFPLNKYYKKNNSSFKKNLYRIFYFSFFISFFVLTFIKNQMLFRISQFLPIFGLTNYLFATPSYLLNDLGVETKKSYLNLKKYLEDFSLIHEDKSEMIVLKNYYLSYSIALGITGIANKEIKSFFGTEIYNRKNNNYNYSSQNNNETSELINNIKTIISDSEELYKNR